VIFLTIYLQRDRSDPLFVVVKRVATRSPSRWKKEDDRSRLFVWVSPLTEEESRSSLRTGLIDGLEKGFTSSAMILITK
jgi:hypothetical protein